MSAVYQIIRVHDILRQYSKKINDRLGRIYNMKRSISGWNAMIATRSAVNLNEREDSGCWDHRRYTSWCASGLITNVVRASSKVFLPVDAMNGVKRDLLRKIFSWSVNLWSISKVFEGLSPRNSSQLMPWRTHLLPGSLSDDVFHASSNLYLESNHN